MTDVRFPYGDVYLLDIQAAAIPATGYGWMAMLSTWTPDPTTEQYVADIVASELADGSYARDVLTGGSVSLNASTGVWTVTAANPDFGAVTGGEVIGNVVLYADEGSDAASVLIGAFAVTHTTDGLGYAPEINGLGLIRIATKGVL